MQINMVDLQALHQRLASELDTAIMNVIRSGAYIKGEDVKLFESELAQYLGVKHVISCANGTEALQLALMALNLQPGDEVITTAQSFIAAAEAIALLRMKPVFVDVTDDYNIDASKIEAAITPRTRAIIPVHLFGKSADMQTIMAIAKKHNLFVIEDTAQAMGAELSFNGETKKAGTVSHIGTTSFFPTKNLACMGDGGAIWTNDDQLARTLRMLAQHGSEKKYHNELIGINSRLDTIQAAVLRVKLRYLDEFNRKRQWVAKLYNQKLADLSNLITLPHYPNSACGEHVYHQYTIAIKNADSRERERIRAAMKEDGVSTMVYFPVALHKLPVFAEENKNTILPMAEKLQNQVIALPMHSEMTEEQIDYVCQSLKKSLVKS